MSGGGGIQQDVSPVAKTTSKTMPFRKIVHDGKRMKKKRNNNTTLENVKTIEENVHDLHGGSGGGGLEDGKLQHWKK